LLKIYNVFTGNITISKVNGLSTIIPVDARQSNQICDLWITYPPYADAINYHELSEFFLAWYEKHLPHAISRLVCGQQKGSCSCRF